jgi:DNA-binding beta-propeller fold protein YncE
MPLRGETVWRVLDAQTGASLAELPTERGKRYDVDPIADIGPHNTWMNPAGTHVYMEVLTVPYIYVGDARTNRVLGKIGPFSKGIRPFAVSDDERWLYANVDALLGFEIAEIQRDFRGGRVVKQVVARTPPERLAEIPTPPRQKPHSTPSHGINLHPNQQEVWMVDGVYGYVYVFDVTKPEPPQIASIPIFADAKERPHPGWLTFSIDGRYAYPEGGVVIDTRTKKVVARIPTSEKLVEVDFENGRAVRAGHR